MDTAHEPETIVLRLAARPVVRGRILLPEGEAAMFVEVFALALDDGAAPDPARPRRAGLRTTASGPPDRLFRFEGLPPGRVLIGAAPTGGDVVATSLVTLEGGSVWADLIVPEPSPADAFTVVVTGPAGEVVSDASVDVGIGGWTPPIGIPSPDVTRTQEGRFRVRRTAGSQGKGARTIVVRSATFGRKDLPFPEDATTSVQARFDATAALVVSVAGAQEQQRAGMIVRVQVRPASRASGAASIGGDGEKREVSPSGDAMFAALQPGDYELAMAVEPRSGATARTVAVERVTLRPGANHASVQVPDLATLTAEVNGAAAGVSVLLSALPGGPPVETDSATTDAEGRVRFDALPPGRYHVRCTIDGRLCVGVADVPRETVVTLRAIPR